MNSCNCNPCNPCGDCKKCCPARYDCSFNIEASPYDPSTWMVTIGGMMHKVKVPGFNETDTTLSTNYTNSTLIYNAERHTDTITGEQLGGIINLDYLRNVDIDEDLDGHCYELVFRKYAECGEGCKSALDKWTNFNINSEGALRNGIQYVRGANQYGCPVYLDEPPRTDEYWWGMWRPDDTGYGVEFGYIQPEYVDSLPTDEHGNTLVLSQDENGKPVIGPIAASLCSGAVQFTTRWGNPQGPNYFTPNSTTVQEFLITPDDNPNWRAPVCGVMIVNYCVNPYHQYATGTGYAEVDVTCLLDNQTWNSDYERVNSTHSTWMLDVGRESDISESCSAAMVLPKGRTIKLHARNTGDTPPGMAGWSGQWRVHAVKAVFIPLDITGA